MSTHPFFTCLTQDSQNGGTSRANGVNQVFVNTLQLQQDWNIFEANHRLKPRQSLCDSIWFILFPTSPPETIWNLSANQTLSPFRKKHMSSDQPTCKPVCADQRLCRYPLF